MNERDMIVFSRERGKEYANTPFFTEIDLLHVEALIEDQIRSYVWSSKCSDIPEIRGIMNAASVAATRAVYIIEQLRLNRRLVDR